MLLLTFLVSNVVLGDKSYLCTPIDVWDGDGPIWYDERPWIRLSGIAARELNESRGPEHPCPGRMRNPSARGARAPCRASHRRGFEQPDPDTLSHFAMPVGWGRRWLPHRSLMHFVYESGHQLCDSLRKEGLVMGSPLAREGLSMREQGSDPDPRPPKWVYAEAGITALIVAAGYATITYFLTSMW